MSKKSWIKVIALIAVIAALWIGVHAWRGDGKDGKNAAATKGAQAVPVKVAPATRGDVDLAIRVIGRAEAYSTVTMRARVDGQLQALNYTPGGKVKQGDVIASIDPSLLQAQLAQASGNVARDRAQLVKARADNARYTEMVAKGYVSRADYDTYKANLGVAEAALQSDLAAEQLARTQLGYARIVAPFDAVAGQPLAYPGATIQANVTDLVVLNQVSPIRITFNIPEDSLPSVRAALARGPVAVTAKITGDTAALTGELEFVDNTVTTTTGTILLKARVPNADGRMTPGQYAEVSLPTARIANAVSVPVVALQTNSNGAFVFVVGPDNKVKQTPVTPGATFTDRVVIDKGLAEGQSVVTDGQLLLVDGSTVKTQGT
jgi:multidrug efflux system membrane fusion protein